MRHERELKLELLKILVVGWYIKLLSYYFHLLKTFVVLFLVTNTFVFVLMFSFFFFIYVFFFQYVIFRLTIDDAVKFRALLLCLNYSHWKIVSQEQTPELAS